jgi:hypothetical protein
MGATYRLPTQVRLQFSDDGAAHDPTPAIAQSLEAQWQRAYLFWDCGYSDGLWLAWGAMTGELTATDLMLATDYAHTTSMPSGTLWLPEELTPVTVGHELDTVDIAIYMDPDGAAGDVLQSFPCVARPEQISPQQLSEGLAAAVIAWRWEIREDASPTITT